MVIATTMRPRGEGASIEMSWVAGEARIMAEKYRALAETTDPVGRLRFIAMMDWWLRRAAELEGASQIRNSNISNPDT
jgi:hypothetical protein